MSQQFCLKWNNHMNNMMDVFKNLLSTESMVDVTLACDGLSLKAHKMVLSACSPFFQSLFLENPCKHPIVILKDMKYTELKAIIEFMYHGEVNVAQEQLSALMKTAETLRVKGLAEMPNEKNSSSSAQEEPSHRSVPRTETPPPSKRRRGRVRKRSLSDSNRSDDSNDPKIKQPHSPDIEELSGDVTMDNTSGQFSNLQSQVPMQSLPSHSTPMNSYQKVSSVVSQDPQIEEPASADESEFGVEPAKLLEQTLTTDDLQNRRSSRSAMSSGMEMQRRPRSSTDHSSNLVPTSMSSDTSLSANQQPESPPDIKPELLELDPPMSPVAGPSHSTDNSMMMYMDQSSVSSHPGTSFQDNTALVPQDSQPQGESEVSHAKGSSQYPYVLLTKLNLVDSDRNKLNDTHVPKESDSFAKTDEHVLNRSNARKRCYQCKMLTIRKCQKCDLHFCDARGTGRECFNLYHAHQQRLNDLSKNVTVVEKPGEMYADTEISSDDVEGGIGRSISNGTDAVMVSHDDGQSNPEIKHTPFSMKYKKLCFYCKAERSNWRCKTCDKSLCIQETGETCFHVFHSKVKQVRTDGHALIRSFLKRPCLLCRMFTMRKCQKCNRHFCDAHRTGRECFNLYHDRVQRLNDLIQNMTVVEKPGEMDADTEISSADVEEGIGHSLSNGTDAVMVSDDDGQNNPETEHTPFSGKYKKLCSYCKAERSNWRCNMCGKSLCIQKTGETCFHMFHSKFKKETRSNMKSVLQAFAQNSY